MSGHVFIQVFLIVYASSYTLLLFFFSNAIADDANRSACGCLFGLWDQFGTNNSSTANEPQQVRAAVHVRFIVVQQESQADHGQLPAPRVSTSHNTLARRPVHLRTTLFQVQCLIIFSTTRSDPGMAFGHLQRDPNVSNVSVRMARPSASLL
jgi:hypothetical protein